MPPVGVIISEVGKQDKRAVERWLNEAGHTASDTVIQREGTPAVPLPTIERLLVVADAAVADVENLPIAVRALIDAAVDVYVVTPSLPGRLEWLFDQNDRARHLADERLDRVLGHMRTLGSQASGATGDDSIMTALSDAVAEFHPDHILIKLSSSEHANWQERGLIEHVEQRFDVPLTAFRIEPRAQGSNAD